MFHQFIIRPDCQELTALDRLSVLVNLLLYYFLHLITSKHCLCSVKEKLVEQLRQFKRCPVIVRESAQNLWIHQSKLAFRFPYVHVFMQSAFIGF